MEALLELINRNIEEAKKENDNNRLQRLEELKYKIETNTLKLEDIELNEPEVIGL